MMTSRRWLLALAALGVAACGGSGEAAPAVGAGDAGVDASGHGGGAADGGADRDGGGEAGTDAPVTDGAGGGDAGAAGADGAVDGSAGGGDGDGAADAADASEAADATDAADAVDAPEAASDASVEVGEASDATDGGAVLAGERVRVVAANLTSGNLQSYDPGHGIRILQGIHADVVLMQEMNYGDGSPAKLTELVTAVCGATCAYTRGVGDIPNGVVSRHPILEAGEWPDPEVQNRDFVWARIDVPGPVDLWAISVHLLTSNEAARNAEAASLLADVQAKVPAGDFVVVGGDFNTKARTESALVTLSALFATGAPYPMDNLGNENTNGNRTHPYDWVLPSPSLAARATAVTLGAAAFSAGLVVDTRVYSPLIDLAPALASDSAATNMQHMAVVRDFLLE